MQYDGENAVLWKLVQNDSGEWAIDFVCSPLFLEKAM